MVGKAVMAEDWAELLIELASDIVSAMQEIEV